MAGKKKGGGSGGSPLVRAARQNLRSMAGEQPDARKLARQGLRAAVLASAQPSRGRTTKMEARAVRKVTRSVRRVTTVKEGQGTRKIMNRKAKRS